LCFVQHNKAPATTKQNSTDDTTLDNWRLAEHTHSAIMRYFKHSSELLSNLYTNWCTRF